MFYNLDNICGQMLLLLSIVPPFIFTEIVPIVVDTDAGSDDAVAISTLILASNAKTYGHDYRIEAITCTYGNTALENVERNVREIVSVLNSTVPIYSGARRPIIAERNVNNFFHGIDGFGDRVDRIEPPTNVKLNKTVTAVMALIELSYRYAGKLTILVLGPCTNVATAALVDPNFVSRVRTFYVMGGSVHGRGNVMPGAEFNFAADPEMAYVLLDRAHRHSRLILLPFDTNLITNGIPKKWRTDVLGKIDSNKIRLLNSIEKMSLDKTTHWECSDGLLAAIVLVPNIITHSRTLYVRPLLRSTIRGALISDYCNITNSRGNAEVVFSVDLDLFKKFIYNVFKA